MTDLPENWQDNDTIHASDLDAIAHQVNQETHAASTDEANISALQTEEGNDASAINTLDTRLDTDEANISALQSSTASTNIDTLTANEEADASNIATLQGQVSAITAQTYAARHPANAWLTLPRDRSYSPITPTSGDLLLTYGTIDQALSATHLAAYTASAGAAITLAQLGIYTVAGNGDLTLVASSASDTSLFATPNAEVNVALSASYNLVANTQYAFAVLVAASNTMPALLGVPPLAVIGNAAPRIMGKLAGQTALPASVTAASVLDAPGMFLMKVS